MSSPGPEHPSTPAPEPDAARIRATLSAPLPLPGGQVVKNRLLKSAMSETLATPSHGVSPELVRLYRTWAEGGIGLSVTGNVMVDPAALGEPSNVVIEDERDLPMLAEWAQAAKSQGGLVYMQLNHPGRQVTRGLNAESVAPSAVPFRGTLARAMPTPRALTEAEIQALIARFAAAAAVAATAGFDGAQLHGAHGYLVSQFLSPHTNRRTDAWGGTPDGRRRFLLEVLRAMRAATPPGFGVAVKLNSADFQRGGITEEEAMDTVAALSSEGLSFIEVSGGPYEAPAMMSSRQSTREREAYFLTFAEKARERCALPLCVTGGFRSGRAMAAALDSGAVDLVGLARPLGVQPDLPRALCTEGDIQVTLPQPRTGLAAVDRMGMVELLWYEGQMHRMGRGQPPAPDASALATLFSTVSKLGLQAILPRRHR